MQGNCRAGCWVVVDYFCWFVGIFGQKQFRSERKDVRSDAGETDCDFCGRDVADRT